MDLLNADFSSVRDALKEKKISAKEIAQFFLTRIEKLDAQLNSYTYINSNFIAQAEQLDRKISHNQELPLLAGAVFGIKDLLCVEEMPTTAASKILQGFVSPYHSTVSRRLIEAGVLISGKLNQDEFAMGSSNETSFYGPVKNPWDTERVPGGSSGGSAAAQTARLNMGTIGTDTGGSIRQPSSFCNVVGIKPTYGRVSRYGIIAYASSLDQAGPIVSSVKDAALTLQVICGHDKNDGTTSTKTVENFSEKLNKDIKGKKVGYIKEHIEGITDSDILKTTKLALETFKNLGAELVEVSIPLTQYAVPMYYIISASEASSNLSRYDGVRYGYRSMNHKNTQQTLEEFYCQNRSEGFGDEVKRRILLGTYCLSSGYYDAFYLKAGKVRRLLRDQFINAFEKCDVLVGPVTTAPAFKLGEKSIDPLKSYLNDIYTTSTNLCGLPGMSLPFGFANNESSQGEKVKLPIGIQITAKHFDEQTLLNFGYALESTDQGQWARKQKPNVY
jgi:aspartyl-tRNA(Asn)/glutamyl-tRNA(Gln) amidotransferase subunit A